MALIASTSAVGNDGNTTGAINTTGATLLVVWLNILTGTAGATVSDSQGNTWTKATPASNIVVWEGAFYYVENPSVSSSHTFTVAGTDIYAAFTVQAHSGVVTSGAYDQYDTNEGFSGATPQNAGTITPSANGYLVITGFGHNLTSGTFTVSGLTVTNTAHAVGATNVGASTAYVYQTTAASITPSWAWTGGGSDHWNSATISFETGGGAPSTNANAGNAAGTGAANNITATKAVSATAGNAAGTGAAHNITATKAVSATAGNAAGTGTAYGAKVTVAVNVGVAAGTGAAGDITASTSSNTNATAGVATGTGAATGATVTVAVNTGAAAGTGAAFGSSVSVSVNTGAATGTGSAGNITANTSSQTNATADVAAGTGAANNATVSVSVNVGVATGTGAAIGVTVDIPGVFTITGRLRTRDLTEARTTSTSQTSTYASSRVLDADWLPILDDDDEPILDDSKPGWRLRTRDLTPARTTLEVFP